MPLARLQRRLDDPYPVEFPARQVRVDVVRCGDVGRFLVIVELVGIVWNDHLLLADQFEVEAVHGTGEHPGIVIGRATGRTWIRCVISNVRRQFHPALPGQILPSATGLLQWVDGILQQDRFTGATGRPLVVELGLEEDIALIGRRGTGRVVQRIFEVDVAGGSQARVPGRVDVPRVELGIDGMPLVAQQVIPHGFIAIVGDRERHARQGILQSDSTLEGFGADGIFRSVVQQSLRQGHGTVGRIDIDSKRREALEQFLGRDGQLVCKLRGIFPGDHHPRLFRLEGVGTHGAALLKRSGWCGQPAGVGRDTAVGVTRLLGTDAGQGDTEPGRLIRGYGRMGGAGDGQRQGGGQ
ncbi:hypothetical protein D9M71_389660 [compost metagenome]